MVGDRAADRAGAAPVPGVRRRAACWSPTTRRSTSASSSTSPPSRGARGRGSRCSTPRSWPAGSSPATRRRTASSARWPGCSASTTTPNHRALSDARATVDVLHGLIERLGNLGVQTLEELQTFTSRVTHRAAPQAAPRRAPPARARRLPLPGQRRPGALRRHVEGPARRGSAPTSPPPRPAPGWARWSRWRTRVQGIECATPLEAAGPRAAADRRAQAEVQPPLPVPRAGALGQADREPWPRLALVRTVLDDGADYLGPYSSRRPRSARSPPSTRRSRSGSARAAAHAARADRLRAGRDGPVPVPLRPVASAAEDYAGLVGPACAGSVDDPPTSSRRCGPADGRPGGRGAVRGGRPLPRPALGVPARRRPQPAAPGADPVPRGGGGAQGGRPLGGPRGAARPAGGGRRHPAGRGRLALGARAAGERPRPSCPVPGRCPRRPPRRRS